MKLNRPLVRAEQARGSRCTHLAIYLSGPDENELELAWDRPFDEWPRGAQGRTAMAMDDAFDLDALLAAQ